MTIIILLCIFPFGAEKTGVPGELNLLQFAYMFKFCQRNPSSALVRQIHSKVQSVIRVDLSQPSSSM